MKLSDLIETEWIKKLKIGDEIYFNEKIWKIYYIQILSEGTFEPKLMIGLENENYKDNFDIFDILSYKIKNDRNSKIDKILE